MPIIIYNIEYHKTTHIHFEDLSSSELSPALSKRARLHIKLSMIHRQSNMENCPCGGLSSFTEVSGKNLSNFGNCLRAGLCYQEDKH